MSKIFALTLFIVTLLGGLFMLDPSQQAGILLISQRLGFDVKNLYHLLIMFCVAVLIYAWITKWLSRAVWAVLLWVLLLLEGTYVSVEAG